MRETFIEGQGYRSSKYQAKIYQRDRESTGVEVPESVINLVTNPKDFLTQEGIETEKETHQQNGTGPLLRLFI